MGNRRLQILRAHDLLVGVFGTIVIRSHVYETTAWGVKKQHDYFNQVVGFETNLSAAEILSHCLDIEAQLGRVRKSTWESRLMDIDILLYGGQVIDDAPDLVVPHPLLHKRRFVLEPLAEICPDLEHPVLQKSIELLYAEVDDPLAVRKLGFA